MAHVVELKKVTKSFGKKVAVDNVSTAIDKGEISTFRMKNDSQWKINFVNILL